MPFATRWMDEAGFAPVPTAAYVIVLLLAGVAYWILVIALVRVEGRESKFARLLGSNYKGQVSIACYAVAIPLALFLPPLALVVCAGVSAMWLIPDRRFEERGSRVGEAGAVERLPGARPLAGPPVLTDEGQTDR